MSEVKTRFGASEQARRINAEEWTRPQNAFRYQVYLLPEEDGGFSVEAARLPGVASQGETEAEALANVAEAFRGVIESYKARGVKIPWLAEPRTPEKGALERWVFLNG